MILAVRNGTVNQLGIFRLFRGGEDERGVGGSILWLVLVDGLSGQLAIISMIFSKHKGE